MLSTAKRVVATTLVAGSLVVGFGVASASATPAQEAVALSAMKTAWPDQTAKVRKTTCFAYGVAPKQLIAQSVEAVMADSSISGPLKKGAWTRVITKYLAWGCSGPNGAPR